MTTSETRKLPAKEWEPFFRSANVCVEELDACKSSKAKTIKIGHFLSPKVGQEVPVEVKGRSGRATLCVSPGRSKEKRYYFETVWDDQPQTTPTERKKRSPSKKHKRKKPTSAAPGREKKTKSVPKTKLATDKPSGGQPATRKVGGRKPATGKSGGGNAEDWD